MKDMFKLDNKIAIVIGGAGGIGEVLAMALGIHGATVVVSSRNQEAIEGVARKITEASGNEAIAVNAMGLNIKHDAFEYLMEDWDKLFAANVKGTMIACKMVGRVMREQNSGAIVNLSSVRGIRGYTGGNAGYCATKGAVEQITKTLALEWAPHNIRVNALGPALVITPGTKHIAENPELAKKYASLIPLRPGDHPGNEAHCREPRTGQKVCLINSLGKNCVA
jgi:gluconate 5-dehydrogenase